MDNNKQKLINKLTLSRIVMDMNIYDKLFGEIIKGIFASKHWVKSKGNLINCVNDFSQAKSNIDKLRIVLDRFLSWQDTNVPSWHIWDYRYQMLGYIANNRKNLNKFIYEFKRPN